MARIQTGTQIEDRSIPQAKAAKGYLGRAVMITNIWESTCVSFVSKVGYFVDDDVNEHIKRNLQPNSYVFTPVIRLCTSPQGDVVSSQCKVEFLRLSPNKYNKFCEDIRRNPSFTHLELMVDSSGQFETTVPVPVATPIPFVQEIQAFMNTLDVEALLTTIKFEMGSPLSVYDSRLMAQHQFEGVPHNDSFQQQGAQGTFPQAGGFPQFTQPATTLPGTSPAGQGLAQPPKQFSAPAFQQASAPAFQQASAPAFQQASAPAFQQASAPAFQQASAPHGTSPADPQGGQPAPAPHGTSPADPQGGQPATAPQGQQAGGSVSQGSFKFPVFGGFVDGNPK